MLLLVFNWNGMLNILLLYEWDKPTEEKVFMFIDGINVNNMKGNSFIIKFLLKKALSLHKVQFSTCSLSSYVNWCDSNKVEDSFCLKVFGNINVTSLCKSIFVNIIWCGVPNATRMKYISLNTK